MLLNRLYLVMPKSKARSTEVPSRQAGNKQDAIAPTVYILSTKDIINSCHRQVAKNIYWIQIQLETLRKVDRTFYLFILQSRTKELFTLSCPVATYASRVMVPSSYQLNN